MDALLVSLRTEQHVQKVNRRAFTFNKKCNVLTVMLRTSLHWQNKKQTFGLVNKGVKEKYTSVHKKEKQI